jgi:hypothetical protein
MNCRPIAPSLVGCPDFAVFRKQLAGAARTAFTRSENLGAVFNLIESPHAGT